MLLSDDENAVLRARKWSTQSRDEAPWYQHTELGYNYRMSNVLAGIARGQLEYLEEHSLEYLFFKRNYRNAEYYEIISQKFWNK